MNSSVRCFNNQAQKENQFSKVNQSVKDVLACQAKHNSQQRIFGREITNFMNIEQNDEKGSGKKIQQTLIANQQQCGMVKLSKCPSVMLLESQQMDHNQFENCQQQNSDSSITMVQEDNQIETQRDVSEQDNLMFEKDAQSNDVIACYSRQIFDYLLKAQMNYLPENNYMNNFQTDINEKMRAILIDWLVDVHFKFKLQQETLFMTVNLIDRFLQKRVINRKELQLVGVAAMFIACKYEEIYAPELKDFVYVCDRAYTKEEILAMESYILQIVDFNLTQTSSLRFLQRYMQLNTTQDEKILNLAHYLLELGLIEIKMLKYTPSNLGASALFLANKILNQPSWNDQQEQQTQLYQNHLKPCARDLLLILQNVDKASLKAVKRKFSQQKFNEIAKIQLEKN